MAEGELTHEHEHHNHEEGIEMVPVFMNANRDPGFLVRVPNGTYHFEDLNGAHVSVHVWRLR